MQVIPSIDLERGRSRIVFWPGVSSGIGAPTDRPDRIAEHFVGQGARLIHLVDFDGARAGTPINLETVGAVASRIATPLQVAGGVDTADGIRLAFAAGATRVLAGLAVADDPATLRACLEVAGDWLAVGLDARAERLAAFPWRRASVPTLRELAAELVGTGVGRLVLGHGGGAEELETVADLRRSLDVEIVVAGGVRDLDGIRRLRDVGVEGIILGEALLSGAIDFPAAQEAAA
jgi:phosphoribosylformimino-5-aminoimidazole carboxamide ribotide isomerase